MQAQSITYRRRRERGEWRKPGNSAVASLRRIANYQLGLLKTVPEQQKTQNQSLFLFHNSYRVRVLLHEVIRRHKFLPTWNSQNLHSPSGAHPYIPFPVNGSHRKGGERTSGGRNFLLDDNLQKQYLVHLFTFYWRELSLITTSGCKGAWEMWSLTGQSGTQTNSLTVEQENSGREPAKCLSEHFIKGPQYFHLSVLTLCLNLERRNRVMDPCYSSPQRSAHIRPLTIF